MERTRLFAERTFRALAVLAVLAEATLALEVRFPNAIARGLHSLHITKAETRPAFWTCLVIVLLLQWLGRDERSYRPEYISTKAQLVSQLIVGVMLGGMVLLWALK